MGLLDVVVILILGAVVGWLASILVKGHGGGLVMNIIVGVLGALLAGWLFPMLGLSLGGSLIAKLIMATIGAVILLAILGFVKKKI